MNIPKEFLLNLTKIEIQRVLALAEELKESVLKKLLEKAPLVKDTDSKPGEPTAFVWEPIEIDHQTEFEFFERNSQLLSDYLQRILQFQSGDWRQIKVEIEFRIHPQKMVWENSLEFELDLLPSHGEVNFKFSFFA